MIITNRIFQKRMYRFSKIIAEIHLDQTSFQTITRKPRRNRSTRVGNATDTSKKKTHAGDLAAKPVHTFH